MFDLIRVGRVNNYGFIWELQKERDRKISGMKSNQSLLIHAKGQLAPSDKPSYSMFDGEAQKNRG